MNEKFTLTQSYQLPELFAILTRAVAVGEHEISIKKRVKQRSILQNSSLHKYCEIISAKLVDAGIDQKSLVGSFKDGFTIPCQPHMIKDIFRSVGMAMFKKESTADLTTVEIQSVFLVVDKRLSEITGVSSPWPSNQPPAYDGEKY